MGNEQHTVATGAANAIARLREHADAVEGGWIPTAWSYADDGRPLAMAIKDAHFGRVGIFDGLTVEAGQVVTVTTSLDLPETLFQVPLAGEPVHLTADGTYPIDVFVDGKRVFGDDLPIVASGPALVEILEAATPGTAHELRFDISFVAAAKSGNGPHLNVMVKVTTPALVHRHGVVDATYARLLLADGLAVSQAERDAVDAAADLVPENVGELSTPDLEVIADKVKDALAAVAPRVEAFKVHCVAHSHIDLAWLWQWADTREVIKRDFRSVLGLMDEFKEFHFTHSQPATYALIEAEEPELFAAVRDHIAEGRWEVAALQWVEGDTNLASGPAQARQVHEAVQYARTHLGVQPDVWLAPDTFGHAGNIPQLAASGGAKTYYHHRGNPGPVAGGTLAPAYWWEGDDGTRVLAISTPVYLGPLTAGRVARDVLALGHGPGLKDVCYFYGAGDHGGGPTRLSFERLLSLQDQPGLPQVASSTLGAYSAAVRQSGAPLPVHTGESITVFEGCYTSHADTKRWNRDGENLLTAAETLATVAGTPTEGLQAAWRQLLFNQFHDILDGSAIHEAYGDQAVDFGAIEETALRVRDLALDRLEADGPADAAWLVTNPLPVARHEPILLPEAPAGDVVAIDGEGRRYPTQRTEDGTLVFVAPVPPLATAGFRLEPTSEPDPAIGAGEVKGQSYPEAAFHAIDTRHFYAQVRKDCGVITTLFDKRVGRELVGYASARAAGVPEQVRPDLAVGVLQVLHEHPHTMSSWVIDDVYEETSLIRGASADIVEDGPVRLVVKTTHSYRSSTITSRVIFYADLPRIDFVIDSRWEELGGPEVGVPNLVLSFGSRLDGAEAWYETPFAAAHRPSDGLVVPALRWADMGDDEYGLALLNDGKYGHDALGTRLRVHLVRGSYEPDPTPEVGRDDHACFTLLPHSGSWVDAGVVSAAAALNQPLAVRPAPAAGARSGRAIPFRPELIGAATAAIASLRLAADGTGPVVTAYETAGRPDVAELVGLPPHATVWDVSATDDRRTAQIADPSGILRVAFRPFQVRHLLIEHAELFQNDPSSPEIASATTANGEIQP